MSELLDLYDINRKKTGAVLKRNHPIQKQLYTLSVSVWIINELGQHLMSRRHSSKRYPLCWECTGGYVLAGEESLQGAIREVKEELGIDLDVNSGRLVYSRRRDALQDFYDVWIFPSQVELSDVTLQKEEVIDVKWMTLEEIKTMEEKHQLHPLLNYYNNILPYTWD